jgi:hypothetical protein
VYFTVGGVSSSCFDAWRACFLALPLGRFFFEAVEVAGASGSGARRSGALYPHVIAALESHVKLLARFHEPANPE